MVTLANVMRANAISCLLFGMIFLTIPIDVARFLDLHNPAPKFVMLALGVILMINGLDLIRVSRHSPPSKAQIWYFSLGDFVWTIMSLGLVFSKTWITTKDGIIVTLLVAVMVATFGILQLLKRNNYKAPNV